MKIWLTIATFLFFTMLGEPVAGAFFGCIVWGLISIIARVLRPA